MLTNDHVDREDFPLLASSRKSEGIYNFRTFITERRGALHEATVSTAKSQRELCHVSASC